ncbi:MAG: hypothetical protein P4L44_13275 [Oryzomonas sp.]|uniref:hypothetical protein n=1 Tax=Oryzomonas sp. TaxID=2855186 RepID=UPI00284FF9BB|nr:hypothetical protein [Oryzomonas sp.]MDR3580926.1 hypothetical protein [Oryzomonas sp.]
MKMYGSRLIPSSRAAIRHFMGVAAIMFSLLAATAYGASTNTVTVTQVSGGTITCGSGGTETCSGSACTDTWKQNDTASYTITPNAGYVLVSYTVDGTTTTPTTVYDNSNPYSLSISMSKTNHTLTAAYANTNTVTVVQSGTVQGTVTACPPGTTSWPSTGSASYAVQPTVGSGGASIISSIKVTPTAPMTGTTQTITLAYGGTGYTCSSPLTFPMNERNETLTITYTGSDAVVKTVNTNGSASTTGGSVASCNYYGSDDWQPLATASYSIVPNPGYVLSSISISPATATTSPTGSTQAAGYQCGNYTFLIGAQTQSLTANFTTAVSVAGSIQESYLTSLVNLSCNNTTGVCTATDKTSGATVGTLTSCNGSNSWGQNQTATYMITPGKGFQVFSVSAAGTTTSSPPSGGYTACTNGYTFNAGTGTTLSVNFLPSSYAPIYGTKVDSSGVSGGDILVGGASVVSGSNSPFYATPNAAATATFSIPAGAGIKYVYWTPSGGTLVDVTAMVTCGGSSPVDYTGASGACQFTIPAGSATTPNGTAFTGVGNNGGTVEVVYDKAYTFAVTATTTGCSGSNGGLVNGVVSKTYNVVNGAMVTVTGTAASGYAIKDVTYNNASIGVATSQLGSSYSYSYGPISTSGNTGAYIFTPVFTVNSNSPVSTPVGSTATGTITPGSQQVICGAAILPITITPTAPATLQDVTITSSDGTTIDLGAVTALNSSIASLGSVQKSWTITATFYQAPITSNNYAIVPSFVQSSILPNLLLMIDNSASQYDIQYDSTGQCYDNNAYLNATTYAGYFSNTSYYSYNAANSRFESGASLPSSCTYLTPYFCVNMSGTKPNRAVTNFVASGNFLNYLAMSKLDIQKMILTGGKYDTVNGNLVPETRGCGGKRFAKIIAASQASSGSTESLANLTFVVRGPNASSGTNFNPAVMGGTTNIDIYDYSYANQIATCQTAFNDWATGSNQGTTQNDTNACISSSVTNPLYTSQLQAIHACYYTMVKGNSAPPQGQTNNVESACSSIYTGSPAVSPSSITSNQAGDAICSSVISYAPTNGLDIGYIGSCWNGSGWTSNTCVVNQILNFCSLMNQNQVTDPSSSNAASTSSVGAAMPGFFMDAGINSLGTPAATYLAILKAPSPTGLIAQFANVINFGAMTFNFDGSGSECIDVTTTTTLAPNQIACARHCSNNTALACYFNSDCGTGNSCVTNTKLDGGQIISNITSGGGVGDHSSGLINAVDNITANSWTPWGEAFYDAIGYFANNTTYRLQTSDWNSNTPPPSESCRLNNILIVTDGQPTADQNAAVGALAQQYNDGTTSGYGTCSYYAGSKNVAAMAWIAQNRDIHNLTQPADHTVNNEYITTYIVYSGPQAQSTSDCDPYNLMTKTATDGGSTMFYATDPGTLFTQLQTAFTTIATTSASGTAASILNNSQGSGANLLQAVFYPKKVFTYTDSSGNTQQNTATWIGEMQNLWYYVDPYLGNSTVREDSDQNFMLSLLNDYILNFSYSQNQTVATRYKDQNGDGSVLVNEGTVTFDNLNSLWKAGRSLWNRNQSTDPRNIYTILGTLPANGSALTGVSLQAFASGSGSFSSNTTAQSYLQVSTTSAANTLIDYISGIDQSIYRGRKVTIPNCGINDAESCLREWKLGDIIDSTPKLVSNVSLNNYAAAMPYGYADFTYSLFTNSTNYQQRGMAFVGGNDGMLHAFRLGILDTTPQYTSAGTIDPHSKARLMYPYGSTATSSSNLGREEWAFIPMDALPYLKYLGDMSYPHLYYVDDTVTLADMSIAVPANNNNVSYPNCSAGQYYSCQKLTTLNSDNSLNMSNTSWRTVLIGGMGLGGATRDLTNTSCVDQVSSGTCVKTPISGIGYSSYFALDVTNPHNLPGTAGGVNFLWEFNANGQLGYSLSGPAVVRIGPAGANGRWFAVFGSGPTGPIDTPSHSFYGVSDQNLKLYVVDIATGTLATTIDTGVPQAFAGTLSSAVIDTDRNYSDDAVYIGYTRADTTVTPNTWTKGGVLRLQTKQNQDPTKWSLSTLIDGVGPITTSIAKLQNTTALNGQTTGMLWIYFGTGRYYYKSDLNSPPTPFQLYGVLDPCYSENSNGSPTGPTNTYDTSCTASVNTAKLVNQTGSASTAPVGTLPANSSGWYVNLALSETYNGNSYYAERVITNPVANTNGTVFFSSFLPSSDICGVGGNTYIWALNYNSGGAPAGATMQGSLMMQVSTGDLQQVSLATAFSNPNQKAYNNRRLTTPLPGIPPIASGMTLLNRPRGTSKIMQIQEK